MITSEYAPLAKTGGLADATAGLSRALCAAGHDVRVLLPAYSPTDTDSRVRLGDGSTLSRVELAGQPQVYVHAVPSLAGGSTLYTGDERDAHRFAALGIAAAEFATSLAWQVDVYHCHDWHAGLVADALTARAGVGHKPTVLTLHNIGYQGDFASTALAGTAFESLGEQLAPGGEPRINFLRRGVSTADELTTVSPTYAREILTPEFGMGLETLLTQRRNALTGILNGVDYDTWDPRIDPYLGHHYAQAGADAKLMIKQALCARFGLDFDPERPVIGLVSRLAVQKGVDILAAAIPAVLQSNDCAFALLGSGDSAIETALVRLADDHPGRVAFLSGYNEVAAHEVIGGGDFLIVPSRYEPCGLTQLYALRFGTIPIVRATGGLADTVQHFDPTSGQGNGCVFKDADPAAMIWAIETALEWYRARPTWIRLQTRAMQEDHSWSQRVAAYVEVYERAGRSAGRSRRR